MKPNLTKTNKLINKQTNQKKKSKRLATDQGKMIYLYMSEFMKTESNLEKIFFRLPIADREAFGVLEKPWGPTSRSVGG